jgi:hypothetical protein
MYWMLLQQFCTPGKGFRGRMLDWQFFEGIVCQYADPIGFYTVGMLFYGSILMSLYITTRSPVLPAVLLLTTGGAIIAQIAAPAMPFVVLVILANGAGALAYLYAKLGSSY